MKLIQQQFLNDLEKSFGGSLPANIPNFPTHA
jgi:hypothetical protein